MIIFLFNTKPNPPFLVYLFSITSIDLTQLKNLKWNTLFIYHVLDFC
jgi:hypothetical protein